MSTPKQTFRGFGKLSIASAQTALPSPATAAGDVQATWNQGSTTPGEFDLEIYAETASVDLTVAELFGIVQNQLEIASDDVDTVDFANNELDITTHGLLTGDGPIQLTSTGTLPTGLALATDYYVITIGAGSISLANSLVNAIAGTAVAFSDVGSGTHSILGSASGDFLGGAANSYRIKRLSYGLLGRAADGAISLTATEGYTTRITHRPRTVAYAVEATLSTPTGVSIQAYPVQDA